LVSAPGINQLILLNPDQKMIRQVVIMEMSGKLIKKLEVNAPSTKVQTDIHGQIAGYYIVQVIETNGKSTMLQYIKQ
jgi:hypothetical protein